MCFLGLGLMGVYFWLEYNRPVEAYYEPELIVREEKPEPGPESQTEPEAGDPATYYPVGKLMTTEEREAYVDGQIQLYIPRLDFKGPVWGATDDETLKKGVGLFDYSQLPGGLDRNANVSIAGHRDIYNMEFYYIDTIQEGDLIYLTYQGSLYTYRFEESLETDAYNWDPIRIREYPCITLQSCTPIGISVNRIFVVGRLIDVTPGADFPGPGEALQSPAAA